jgi:hypothetical protein
MKTTTGERKIMVFFSLCHGGISANPIPLHRDE